MSTKGFASIAAVGVLCCFSIARAQAQEAPTFQDDLGVVRVSDESPIQPAGYNSPAGYPPMYQQTAYQNLEPVPDGTTSTSPPTLTYTEPYDSGAYGPSYSTGNGYGNAGIVAGVQVMWLKPHFSDNSAFTVLNATNPAAFQQGNREFDYDYEEAPKFWLGYVGGGGFGGRISYWQFDHTSSTEAFTNPGANFTITGPDFPGFLPAPTAVGVGGSIAAESDIDAWIIDAELTQRLRPGSWTMNVGGGFRHAEIAQGYDAVTNNGGVVNIFDLDHRFDGNGPTFFAELRRPIYGSNFAFLANARASILYGDAKVGASRQGPAFLDSVDFRERSLLTIAELFVGAEYGYISGRGSRYYLRAGWDAQNWHDANGSAAQIGDLVLAGFSGAVGLDW